MGQICASSLNRDNLWRAYLAVALHFLLYLQSLSRGQGEKGFEYRSQSDYLVARVTVNAAKKKETHLSLLFFIVLWFSRGIGCQP